MHQGIHGIVRLAAALLLCGTAAVAQAAPAVPAQAAPATQRLQQSTHTAWDIEWDSHYQQVAKLRGRTSALDREPEQAARQFLHQVAGVLELQAGLVDLVLVHSKRTPAGTHLQFAQRANGRVVWGGGIDVHVSPAGEVFLVHNRYVRAAAIATVPAAPIVTDKAALATAAACVRARTDKAGRALPVRSHPSAAQRELGIRRAPEGLDLAWRIHADGFRVTVSATTAEVLERVPLARSANGTGRVFDPNPVNTLKDPTLRDNANGNYLALGGAYFNRTLTGIQQLSNPVRYLLRGPYVRTIDATSSYFANSWCDPDGTVVVQAPPQRTNSSFLYYRNQPEFEHTMVYFHLDRSQRYIQSLGFLELLNTGIAVDAHAFSADNSFFCPSASGNGYIAFGNGGVDDAEDADVVLHEYGHAMQEDASGGRYDGIAQRGAMGEGFGDYWAYIARPYGYRPACFAEWDVNDGSCLRRLDRNKIYPADIEHEVHADGEIWSQALRELYLALGKPIANTIILESHYLVPDTPSFAEGAQALLDADQELYAGAHAVDICTVTTARGINAAGC